MKPTKSDIQEMLLRAFWHGEMHSNTFNHEGAGEKYLQEWKDFWDYMEKMAEKFSD